MNTLKRSHSKENLDEIRERNIAYEYLCHLEEAKTWIESCIGEPLPHSTVIEEYFRNGVALAKLAHYLCPDMVHYNKIYDYDLEKYNKTGLQFKHTDNINYFLKAICATQLPRTFLPETVDIYEKKNMPRLIYCIHALSRHLFRIGQAPLIQDLFGKVEFTDDEITNMKTQLKEYNVPIPSFQKLNQMLSPKGTKIDTLKSINTAVLNMNLLALKKVLKAPSYHVIDELLTDYMNQLNKALLEKKEQLQNHSLNESFEPDEFCDILTQTEIQGYITQMNIEYMWCKIIENYKMNVTSVWDSVKHSNVNIQNLIRDHELYYKKEIELYKAQQSKSSKEQTLKSNEKLNKIQKIIYIANEKALNDKYRNNILKQINELLQKIINSKNSNSSSNLRKNSSTSLNAYKKNNSNSNVTSGFVKQTSSLFNKNSASELNELNKHTRNVNYMNCLNELFKLLSDKYMNLSSEINKFTLPLYMDELLKEKCTREITYDNLKSILYKMNLVSNITKSLDTKNLMFIWDALNVPQLKLHTLLDSSLQKEYWLALKSCREFKMAHLSSDLLDLSNIIKCIEMVNAERISQDLQIECIRLINDIVKGFCKTSANPNYDKLKKMLFEVLKDPVLKLDGLDHITEDEDLVITLLKEKFIDKNDIEPNSFLWLEEIEDIIKNSQLVIQNIKVFIIENQTGSEAVEKNKENQPTNIKISYSNSPKSKHTGWDVYNVVNRDVYINLSTGKWTWHKPIELLNESTTKKVKPRRSLDKSNVYKKFNEVFFIKLQARCRGYLERKKFYENYVKTMEKKTKSAIKIQRWWKRQKEIRMNKTPDDSSDQYLEQQNTPSMDDFETRWAFYEANVDKIITIQALWRGKMVRNIYVTLFTKTNSKNKTTAAPPSYKILKQFINHLDDNIKDYQTAINLQYLRNEISKLINKNKKLNAIIEDLDLKIYLLVQNRLSLNEIISDHNNIDHNVITTNDNETIKKNMLEKYEYLFYILQTKPIYLTKLIINMPDYNSKKFLESIILTLYNHGQSSRDEYLLLKFLSLLLREEINNSDKYTKPYDIITTPPLVLRVTMQYARMKCGSTSLKTLLKPLIDKIMKEKQIIAYLNPVTIYKKWRNDLEFTTGVPSDLPANIQEDVEAALSYEHVSRTFASGIQKLEKCTEIFLKRIVASKEYIPFGLLYITSQLKSIMDEKFIHKQSSPNSQDIIDIKSSSSLYPDLQHLKQLELNSVGGSPTMASKKQQQEHVEKDIIKVVGHFLYYNFINSAIVAPEVYKVISLKPGEEVTMEQRHNLANIAKLLQFAAAKKGYGEDSKYLTCLNKFITQCHDKLKTFFYECCDVDSLEDHYHINEYSEELLQIPPTIYISIQDVSQIHTLLLTYQYDICDENNDTLICILRQLNEANQLYEAFGLPPLEEVTINSARNKKKNDLCLTLSNKYETKNKPVGENDREPEETNIAKLFIETKELLICVLPCLTGHTLPGALRMETTKEQELLFESRIQSIIKYTNNTSFIQYSKWNLKECKTKLRRYLTILEKHGFVSREDGYQDIVTKLVQDIYNKNKYRQLQNKELTTVKETKESLLEKIKICEEKIDYYEKYMKTCLENQTIGKRNIHSLIMNNKNDKRIQNKATIKYTGRQLYEKGILLDVDGLTHNQLKNILLEFKPCSTYGNFQINGKFMGVQMESVEINIQDLLQKQFNGTSIMDIFGRAKVNVNLLLFMLNKKYYSKN